MSRWISLILFAALGFGVLTLGRTSEKRFPAKSPATPVPADRAIPATNAEDAVDRATIEQILELHHSVGSVLKGSSLDDPAFREETFRAALETAAGVPASERTHDTPLAAQLRGTAQRLRSEATRLESLADELKD